MSLTSWRSILVKDYKLAKRSCPTKAQVKQNRYLFLLKRTYLSFLASPSLPQFNEAAMAQLEAMGFPTIRCQKALLATGNDDPEAAMEWLFGHMEDPGMFLASFLLPSFLQFG